MSCNRLVAALLMLLGGASVLASPNGRAAIIDAAKAGDVAAVRALIRQHADVNAREPDATTVLHWAARSANPAVVELLVAAGANVNAINRYGVTPLSVVAREGNEALLRILFDAGANLRVADSAQPEGQTLLMLASRTGRADAIRLLVEHGADVNAREQRTGTTALMWAAIADRPAAVSALLAAGADLNARSALTDYPHTPPAVVGDALEEGASYVGQTVLPKGGWTALMYAARQGAVGAATVLAEAGADLDVTDPDGSSALMFAIINGHYDLAEGLAANGADANLADRAGMTPLYAAVDMHTLPSTFGRPDLTPPVVAASIDAIKMLLLYGADPDARLKTKILKRVYNPGDARLAEGATPFMRAARGGDALAMRLLHEAGADPALVQANGNTALHVAVGASRGGNNPDRASDTGAMEAIAYCLELGADVNAVNAAGDTPLHLSVASPATVEFLVARGANINIKNTQGRTPLDLALRARDANAGTVALLRRLGGTAATP